MRVLYIIGGLFFIFISVKFIDKRESMKKDIHNIQETKQQINQLNQELDEVLQQLHTMNEPLSKISHVSSEILKYRK